MDDRMRNALALLYQHKADISVKKSVKDGSITKQEKVKLHTMIPCRVSLRNQSQRAAERGIAASTEYDARLYLSPDLDIPQGSEILVTDINGCVTEYIGGRAFSYSSHQEISLKYKDRV